MFGWAKKRIIEASNDAMKNDIARFIASLKGASDSEISTMLVVANIVRLNLTNMGKIPPAALDITIPRVGDLDIKCDMCSVTLANAVKQFQSMNQPSDALGTMIWLHSVRALNVPEIRYLGRAMWQELSRGFRDIDQTLEDIHSISPTPLPLNIENEVRFIPRGLEPNG